MRATRVKPAQFLAAFTVFCLLLFSPLLMLRGKKSAGIDVNTPPQPVRLINFDRPRPEVPIERVLKLDDFNGFDPKLVALLDPDKGGPLVVLASRQIGGEQSQSTEQIARLDGQTGK